MSLEMVPAKVDGDSRATNEPWFTSPELGTQASMATLWAATTHQAPSHWPSGSYQPYTYQLHQWGGEGKGEKWNNWMICCLK